MSVDRAHPLLDRALWLPELLVLTYLDLGVG